MRTAAALLVLLLPALAQAEPYLATREGYKCALCHVNTTGGGMRTDFGNVYAQNRLAAERLATPADAWPNALDSPFTIGGDLRSDFTYTAIPNAPDQNGFEPQDLRVYAAARVIPDRLVVYADQRIAPASINQEAWLRLWLDGGQHVYLKAGKMYLPYGWRLQDQGAFIRTAPGLNMDTPDNGAELGVEWDAWTAQLAVSNGTAGGVESDKGKQESLRVEFVQPVWRLGASGNFNDTKAGARAMGNVFAGLKTGPLAWLAEADYVEDRSFVGQAKKFWAGLLEGDWNFRQGHNFKVTAEYLDPDRSVANDGQARYSGLWEWTPIQFLQMRLGARFYEGIPQNDLQNRRLFFVELHAFF